MIMKHLYTQCWLNNSVCARADVEWIANVFGTTCTCIWTLHHSYAAQCVYQLMHPSVWSFTIFLLYIYRKRIRVSAMIYLGSTVSVGRSLNASQCLYVRLHKQFSWQKTWFMGHIPIPVLRTCTWTAHTITYMAQRVSLRSHSWVVTGVAFTAQRF